MAELTIDSIAAGGDGVGRIDGDAGSIVTFVPRSAPGDRVRARVEVRRRFARGIIEEILMPSDQRVDAICYHYRVDRCGGCQLQHMSYDAQLAAKRAIIHDAIARIGKRTLSELPPIDASDKQWRYRRKLTLALRARRTDRETTWIIGLRAYDDPNDVFQLNDCPITDERVLRVWREVMDASRDFPPADELRASVRLLDASPSDGERREPGASIVMEGGNAWPARRAFFAAVPSADALWWKPAHRPASLVAERGTHRASASFGQVNEGVGRQLHDYVVGRARSHEPKTVVDAYAGTGATAIPLAAGGTRVLAIESDRAAADQCGARLPSGSRAIVARVEDAIADALPADVVLLNPPRVGLHERVCRVLETVSVPPRGLVYVSCDPATLARDLARLGRYRIASLRAFDMFPQTAHVETVCELVPGAA
ncbi:MAG TPA: TRAM domain-containing protein [Gemmatimonadaceae bacterium]|nr:TRAM domain-containing protein [Gemmatimonadaceae bacterium]